MPGEDRHSAAARNQAKHRTQDDFEFSIATAPSTPRHRRLALVVVIAMLLAYAAVIPNAQAQLPRMNSFVPSMFALSIVADLVTAILLFGQYATTRARPLLVLASGYLFLSLIFIAYVLTFPGAFAPAGLLGAGPQTAAWLQAFARAGLALAIAAYALLRPATQQWIAPDRTLRSPILWRVGIVVCVAAGLIFATTAGHDLWPPVLSNGAVLPLGYIMNGVVAMTNVLALLLLARTRGRSILDLWLIVAVTGSLAESIMVAAFVQERYSFAFYAIRLIALPVTKIVLAVLLWESMRLYANLARSNAELRRERANRLTNAAAGLAAIAHEIRQPLAGINLAASSGRRMLNLSPPDIGAAKATFADISAAALRATEVFTNVLSLFKKGQESSQAVDVNDLVIDAVRLMRKDFDAHNIECPTTLARNLPLVQAHPGQLRTVILNLIQNAIDAMAPIADKPRTLSIETSISDTGAVLIALQDTGPGIACDELESIFDPFVTTKAQGTGLGLAICKMIVEQHGGKLSASSGANGGARFEITLPPA